MYRFFWFWNVYKLYLYIVYWYQNMRQVRCIIKCEWANKTYFNGGGGGGEENTKTTYIHDQFGERKYKNFIFTTIVFLGGGGGGEKEEK